MKTLSRDFYEKDPKLVAQNLLGEIMVRRLNHEIFSGKIFETEVYYGENELPSKAYVGRKTFSQLMLTDAARTFIYIVHANGLLKIVAHHKGDVGALLIIAIEPIKV